MGELVVYTVCANSRKDPAKQAVPVVCTSLVCNHENGKVLVACPLVSAVENYSWREVAWQMQVSSAPALGCWVQGWLSKGGYTPSRS